MDLLALADVDETEAATAPVAFQTWCRRVGLEPRLPAFAQWLADALSAHSVDELEALRRDLTADSRG
jgi:hypothetical protein